MMEVRVETFLVIALIGPTKSETKIRTLKREKSGLLEKISKAIQFSFVGT